MNEQPRSSSEAKRRRPYPNTYTGTPFFTSFHPLPLPYFIEEAGLSFLLSSHHAAKLSVPYRKKSVF